MKRGKGMTEAYLQILIESLEKKLVVLDQISELDKHQFEISSARPFDMEAYDETMEQKGELLEELEQLDEGFTSTFELVKDTVLANPQDYKDQVEKMKELIRETVAKSTSIEAAQKRNRQACEMAIANQRQEIRKWKISNSAASRYYKSMSRINDVDPQLMDRKK